MPIVKILFKGRQVGTLRNGEPTLNPKFLQSILPFQVLVDHKEGNAIATERHMVTSPDDPECARAVRGWIMMTESVTLSSTPRANRPRVRRRG